MRNVILKEIEKKPDMLMLYEVCGMSDESAENARQMAEDFEHYLLHYSEFYVGSQPAREQKRTKFQYIIPVLFTYEFDSINSVRQSVQNLVIQFMTTARGEYKKSQHVPLFFEQISKNKYLAVRLRVRYYIENIGSGKGHSNQWGLVIIDYRKKVEFDFKRVGIIFADMERAKDICNRYDMGIIKPQDLKKRLKTAYEKVMKEELIHFQSKIPISLKAFVYTLCIYEHLPNDVQHYIKDRSCP